MSKAIYKFDLSEPDDREDFLRTVKATDMAMVLWEIVYNLRKRVINSYDSMPDEEYDKLRPTDGIYKLMDEIIKLLEERNINVDSLIS